MAAYIVFTREKLRDPAEMKTYSQWPARRWPPCRQAARPYGTHETLEGAPIDGCVIVEFPSLEAAKAWYDSPAYTAGPRPPPPRRRLPLLHHRRALAHQQTPSWPAPCAGHVPATHELNHRSLGAVRDHGSPAQGRG